MPITSLPTFALPVAAILLTLGAFMILFERRRPAWQRTESPECWWRSLLVNATQVAVTASGVVAWGSWFEAPVHSITGNGLLTIAPGYLLITLVHLRPLR